MVPPTSLAPPTAYSTAYYFIALHKSVLPVYYWIAPPSCCLLVDRPAYFLFAGG